MTPIVMDGIIENGRVTPPGNVFIHFNPTALRKVKIVYNFGLSECNKVRFIGQTQRGLMIILQHMLCFLFRIT